MEFNKRMGKSGSVTLPSAIRRQYGLADGEKFQISVKDDGTIQLRRTEGQCLFCQSDEQIVLFKARFVCKRCVSRMNGLFLEGSDRIREI